MDVKLSLLRQCSEIGPYFCNFRLMVKYPWKKDSFFLKLFQAIDYAVGLENTKQGLKMSVKRPWLVFQVELTHFGLGYVQWYCPALVLLHKMQQRQISHSKFLFIPVAPKLEIKFPSLNTWNAGVNRDEVYQCHKRINFWKNVEKVVGNGDLGMRVFLWWCIVLFCF